MARPGIKRLIVVSGLSPFSLVLAVFAIRTAEKHLILIHVRPGQPFDPPDLQSLVVGLGAPQSGGGGAHAAHFRPNST